MPRTIVDIPDTQLRDLDALCESLGISRAEAVRRAIVRFLRDGCESDDGFGLWRAEDARADEARRALEQRWGPRSSILACWAVISPASPRRRRCSRRIATPRSA